MLLSLEGATVESVVVPFVNEYDVEEKVLLLLGLNVDDTVVIGEVLGIDVEYKVLL